MKERKKIDPEISKSEETMELFIKDTIIRNKEFNSLNIFESIQELQKMIPYGCDKLFIEINTRKLMSLSKYKKLIGEEMQKMGIYCIFFKTCSNPKISGIKNGTIKN
jgi:hypothetical protein